MSGFERQRKIDRGYYDPGSAPKPRNHLRAPAGLTFTAVRDWLTRLVGGGRVAVVSRQLKRATVRRQALKLAEDRGLTRRQAKRNRARNKAETKRERRGAS